MRSVFTHLDDDSFLVQISLKHVCCFLAELMLDAVENVIVLICRRIDLTPLFADISVLSHQIDT